MIVALLVFAAGVLVGLLLARGIIVFWAASARGGMVDLTGRRP